MLARAGAHRGHSATRGAALDGRRWVRVPKVSFLFAVKVLSRRFRTLDEIGERHALIDSIAYPSSM